MAKQVSAIMSQKTDRHLNHTAYRNLILFGNTVMNLRKALVVVNAFSAGLFGKETVEYEV